MTMKLNHLHLKTKDPEKTAKFYVDNLGAKIVSQSPGGGCRLDLHGLPINVTKFLESQKREQIYGMEHIRHPFCIFFAGFASGACRGEVRQTPSARESGSETALCARSQDLRRTHPVPPSR